MVNPPAGSLSASVSVDSDHPFAEAADLQQEADAGHSMNEANAWRSIDDINPKANAEDEVNVRLSTATQELDLSDPEAGARSGDLDLVKYLIDKQGDAINYEEIISAAGRAKSSDPNYFLNLLKYLHGEKRVPITDRIYDRIIYAADEAETKDPNYWLDILKYLH